MGWNKSWVKKTWVFYVYSKPFYAIHYRYLEWVDFLSMWKLCEPNSSNSKTQYLKVIWMIRLIIRKLGLALRVSSSDKVCHWFCQKGRNELGTSKNIAASDSISYATDPAIWVPIELVMCIQQRAQWFLFYWTWVMKSFFQF